MAKLTQRQRVVEYVDRFGSITSLDAYNDLGITQLAARLFELRHLNYTYSTTREMVRNRFGDEISIVRYSDLKLVRQAELFEDLV